jgi:hypothetical protein
MGYYGIIDYWYKVVCEYSGRRMTIASDKLVALSAIAKEFQHVISTTGGDTGQSRYVAGLWSWDIEVQLLWARPAEQKKVKPEARPAAYRAPSWSWASVDAQIKSQWRGVRVFRVFGYQVWLKNDALPFGEVTCGVLGLVGAVKRSLFSERPSWLSVSMDTMGEIGLEDTVWYLVLARHERARLEDYSQICGLILLQTEPPLEAMEGFDFVHVDRRENYGCAIESYREVLSPLVDEEFGHGMMSGETKCRVMREACKMMWFRRAGFFSTTINEEFLQDFKYCSIFLI